MTCWICYVDMTVSSEIHTLTGQHSFLASYAKELHKVDPSFPEERHCHVFRHSIGMAMFKAGIPLPYIKDFLGHSSIDSRYICSWIGKGGDTLNEDSTLTEGTVHYDVRFDAIAPTSAHDAASQDVIRLIINVEAQTAFNPGYPLTKRAIYYCSRMISALHGPIFKKSEYGKIRKVYSIWVCTKPSDEFQNTLTRYSICPEQLIGNATEKSENYDLMSVVTICLGKPDSENYTGILKFLDVLLSSSRAATEKKKILEEEFGVAMSEELESEVLTMCNLSQGVRAEGREEGRKEGISIGEIGMLIQLVREGDLKPERAAEKAKMTVEEFKKIMENYPLQTV